MTDLILSPIPLIDFKRLVKDSISEILDERALVVSQEDKLSDSKRFLPVPEFCKHASIARQTFYHKVGRNEIPGAVQFGRKWYVDIEIFDEYLTTKAVRP